MLAKCDVWDSIRGLQGSLYELGEAVQLIDIVDAFKLMGRYRRFGSRI